LAAAILGGDRRALAQSITLLESSRPDHHRAARELLERLRPTLTDKALRIGVTGPPGVGKSTFIDAMGTYLIEQHDKRVAVLALDPSSGQTGGSILGDKTRMLQLGQSAQAFIRPSPTRGFLGGVGEATRETLLLCEAAGYDVIMVETVGVGQSEYAVSTMVDTCLLLALPGAGDELQGMKRGISEAADAIVVNKADGGNVAAAELARMQYQSTMRLLPRSEPGWEVPVVTTSAVTASGIAELWQIIVEHRQLLEARNGLRARRAWQHEAWFWQIMRQRVQERWMHQTTVSSRLPPLLRSVRNRTILPNQAADDVLAWLGFRDASSAPAPPPANQHPPPR